MEDKDKDRVEGLSVLTRGVVLQIDRKVAEAIEIGYAEVTLVIEKGCLRWIRGPAPSEPVRRMQ